MWNLSEQVPELHNGDHPDSHGAGLHWEPRTAEAAATRPPERCSVRPFLWGKETSLSQTDFLPKFGAETPHPPCSSQIQS